MLRLLREIYLVAEAVFSKTGSFGAARISNATPEADLTRRTNPAWNNQIYVFTGASLNEAVEARLAAD